MFGLCVRFTCRDQASAEAYDRPSRELRELAERLAIR